MTRALRGPAGTPGAPLPPLDDQPRVSVVIPARDGATTLPGAVASALGQLPPPDEVIVAVGPSADATREVADGLAAREPSVRVVANPSGRTSDALNAAIAASDGQVVARLDAHAQLPPGYLAAAVGALRATGAGNVGGLQVPVADAGFARAVAAAMLSPLGTGGAAYRSAVAPGAVDTVYLGVFRREAVDAVGGFDPAFLRNQDAELNLRLRAAGYQVWLEPELQVAYRPRGSLPALARQYVQYGRWRRLTARRHRGSLRWRQAIPPAAVVALVGAGLLSLATRRRGPIGVVGGGYALTVAVGGVHAAPTPALAPATAAALATMHLGWGVGFLLGPPRATRRQPAVGGKLRA